MTQVVYYGCLDNMFGYDIEPVRDRFVNDTPNIQFCPAFNGYIKNVFAVKSMYQYSIDWDGVNITSSMYDQVFFNTNLFIRDVNIGFFSYVSPKPVFVSEGDDLNITQEFPYFHDNDITRNMYIIPGTFNIGKHLPRTLEMSGKFKRPGSITINEGDVLYYVRFHTKEKIIFKKFIFSEEMKSVIKNNLSIREHTKNRKSLSWWYNFVSRHNLKKYFLNEIKKNLL